MKYTVTFSFTYSAFYIFVRVTGLLLLILGNDNIHLISTNGHHELSIYMEKPDGTHRWGNYTVFSVANEMSKYRLTVTGFTGDARGKCV